LSTRKSSKYSFPIADVSRLAQTLLSIDAPPSAGEIELVALLRRPEMRRAVDHLRSLGYADERVAEAIAQSGVDVPVGPLVWALRAAQPGRPQKRRRVTARASVSPAPAGGPPRSASSVSQEPASPPAPSSPKVSTVLGPGRATPSSVALRQSRL